MTRHIRRSKSRDLAVKNKSEVVDFSELDGDEFYHSPGLSFSLSRCVCHSPSAFNGFTKLQEHNVTGTELNQENERDRTENCTGAGFSGIHCPSFKAGLWRGRGQLKCDGTRAGTRFRLSAKRKSPFKSSGASFQLTTGCRGVRISGRNAGYTMFRGSVKGTGYPLHSQVSSSLPLPCVTVCHHISTGVYYRAGQNRVV